MIEAVIFDCFGVLTTDGWLAFKHKYLPEGSDEEAEATQLNRQTDAGLISYQEFVRGLAELTHMEPRDVMSVVDHHVPNEQLFSYIKEELKPRYKIGLLSNAAANYMPELFEPSQVELFDEMTFSFELGVVKPDPKMYETIAAKLSVSPETCVFIDDREGFAEGAKQTGMKAIWYQSNGQCIRELEVVLRGEANA